VTAPLCTLSFCADWSAEHGAQPLDQSPMGIGTLVCEGWPSQSVPWSVGCVRLQLAQRGQHLLAVSQRPHGRPAGAQLPLRIDQEGVAL